MATGGTKTDKAKADAAAEEARKKREAEEAEEEDDEADDADEDEDEDEGDEDEDEDEDEPADAAPAAKIAAAASGPATVSAGSKGVAKSPVGKGAPPAKPRPTTPPVVSPAAAQQSGMLKAGSIFVALVVSMGVGFILLGREPANQPAKTYNWKPGQTVDIELTVVGTDRENLACASKDEIAGLKCGFTGPNEARKPPVANNDKLLLKPYTLADNSLQLTAAGLWAEPILAANLPVTRFTVKCKYTVKGTMKTPQVRWEQTGPWYPQQRDWYVGAVSNCKLGTTG